MMLSKASTLEVATCRSGNKGTRRWVSRIKLTSAASMSQNQARNIISLPIPTRSNDYPIVQYADNTLIIVKADASVAANLKRILGDFSSATGLAINFSKTTFVPLNTGSEIASPMAARLATSVASFPQKSLGLPAPLSPQTAPSAFQPVIDRCDVYLAGWCALLLSCGGCLILLSAVLDSLPTYFMMCFSLPGSVLEEINKRRRIFFWSNGDSFSGAKCLVAWDRVCMPKQVGGLCVKTYEHIFFALC